MDWFLKLDQQVQIWFVAVTGVIVVHLLWTIQKVLGPKPPPPPSDWFLEFVKRMPKIETKPQPPRGGSGTAPPQKKDPKLVVTRYYIRRDDGRFYAAMSTGHGWGSKSDASAWTEIQSCRLKCQDLMNQGIKDIRIVDEEVEA